MLTAAVSLLEMITLQAHSSGRVVHKNLLIDMLLIKKILAIIADNMNMIILFPKGVKSLYLH